MAYALKYGVDRVRTEKGMRAVVFTVGLATTEEPKIERTGEQPKNRRSGEPKNEIRALQFVAPQFRSG